MLNNRAIVGASLLLLVSVQVNAALIIDFEGLNDLEAIDEFYNGGFGGLGSGPGPNLGVSFGSVARR